MLGRVKTGGTPAGQERGQLYNQGAIWMPLRSCHSYDESGGGAGWRFSRCTRTRSGNVSALGKPRALASRSGW